MPARRIDLSARKQNNYVCVHGRHSLSATIEMVSEMDLELVSKQRKLESKWYYVKYSVDIVSRNLLES